MKRVSSFSRKRRRVSGRVDGCRKPNSRPVLLRQWSRATRGRDDLRGCERRGSCGRRAGRSPHSPPGSSGGVALLGSRRRDGEHASNSGSSQTLRPRKSAVSWSAANTRHPSPAAAPPAHRVYRPVTSPSGSRKLALINSAPGKEAPPEARTDAGASQWEPLKTIRAD